MRSIFFAILVLFAKTSFSQLDSVHVLLGKSQQTVINYFNKLNSLKPDANYQIKRETTDVGDVELSVEFSGDDEDYYKCSELTASFQRVNGSECCTSQSIFGKIEHADFYLSYLKKHFTSVSDDTWQIPSPVIKGMVIVATYTKILDRFGIIFDLTEPIK